MAGPGQRRQGPRPSSSFNQNVNATVTTTNPAISCSGGASIVCNAGNAGQGVRFTVRASVAWPPARPATWHGAGARQLQPARPDAGNEERTASVPISSTANLVLTQSISPSPPQAGGSATVRPTVTNNGPSHADNVVITVTIPAGVNLVSASGGCSLGGGRLNCALGRLASGASATAQIVYGLGGLAAGSQVTAAATVRSSTADPNGGNNAVAQTFTVGAATADVSIRKSASPNPVPVGGTVTFSMVVSNAGPSDARGLVVTDPLPAGLRLAGAQAPGSCAPLGRTVICNVGTLGAGASATVSISAVVLSSALPGPLVNRVTVQSETADRNPGNNSASISVQIRGGTRDRPNDGHNATAVDGRAGRSQPDDHHAPGRAAGHGRQGRAASGRRPSCWRSAWCSWPAPTAAAGPEPCLRLAPARRYSRSRPARWSSGRELLLDALAAGLAHEEGLVGVGQDRRDGLGHPLGLIGGHQLAVDAGADQLGCAAEVGGDDRNAVGEGLEHGEGLVLVPA